MNPPLNTDDATLLVGILSLVLQAVCAIPRQPRDRTREDEMALSALSDAYTETIQYYEFLKTHQHEPAKAIGVAHKWEHVGILLKKYDATLADRLHAKSRYWRDGANWSDEIIRQAGIGLESIRREVTLRIEHHV